MKIFFDCDLVEDLTLLYSVNEYIQIAIVGEVDTLDTSFMFIWQVLVHHILWVSERVNNHTHLSIGVGKERPSERG